MPRTITAARGDFPALKQSIRNKPLVYLDSAASALKPQQVIDAMARFSAEDYANIHRGVHELSRRATDKYESARTRVARFINAGQNSEIVFTRGATESINLVAASWGRTFLKAGDEIILTTLEHHANIVPWQMLRDEIGIKIVVVPLTPEGDVRVEDVRSALTPKTKLIACAHVSNVLGTVLPVKEIARLAHDAGALLLIDGCQAVCHMPVDVQDIDADFYVFSAHKLYGPTGIGVLYGKKRLLDSMPPYQTGGGMIASVSFEKTIFRPAPDKFEAGTPAIIEAIGLADTIDYLETIGMTTIAEHEAMLIKHATEALAKLTSVKIIGTSATKVSIISFTMASAHPHDIGTILDNEGIAVRAGHHCAEPLMNALNIPATVRASFGLYNTMDDVDALVRGIKKVEEIFG